MKGMIRLPSGHNRDMPEEMNAEESYRRGGKTKS